MWTALAAEPPTEALALVEEGDRLWFTGERAKGARAWRRAKRVAGDDLDGAAAEAMARTRLMRAGSNWAPVFGAGKLNRALQRCEPRHPWCALAYADFHLLLPEALAGDRSQARRYLPLAKGLPARVASRRALMGEVEALESTPVEQRDGLGRAAAEGFVQDEGSWLLGVGVVASPAGGVGGAVHWVHPDVFRRGVWMGADAFVASRSYGLTYGLETPGTVGLVFRASAVRTRWWDAGARDEPDAPAGAWVPVAWGMGHVGAVVRAGVFRGELGPQLRWDVDTVGGEAVVYRGHGLWSALSVDLRQSTDTGVYRGGWFGLSGEAAFGPLAEYSRYGLVADVRGYLPAARGVLAGRLRGEGVLGEDIPTVRLPSLGGPWVHRGARPGQFRGRWTATVDLELRHPIAGPLWFAVFGDLALIDGPALHGGGGGGLRFVFPPQPYNTVRMDVAFADSGWQLMLAWGEAF